jgi:hypothetical protein
MYKNDIGINAGVIWRLLEKKGALSIVEIKEFTDFQEFYIHMALGWLSREGKIRFFLKGDAVCVELEHYREQYY